MVNRWGDLVTSLSSDACVGVQLYLPERDVLVADAAHARGSPASKIINFRNGRGVETAHTQKAIKIELTDLMMQLRRFAGRLVRGGGGPSFCRRSCTTSIAPEVTVEDALAAIAKEPILHRLGSIFHPWPQVAKVVSPQELHSQLGTFASTTGTVGALLSSVIGAGLLAEPPKYSSEAQEKTTAAQQAISVAYTAATRLVACAWRRRRFQDSPVVRRQESRGRR